MRKMKSFCFPHMKDFMNCGIFSLSCSEGHMIHVTKKAQTLNIQGRCDPGPIFEANNCRHKCVFFFIVATGFFPPKNCAFMSIMEDIVLLGLFAGQHSSDWAVSLLNYINSASNQSYKCNAKEKKYTNENNLLFPNHELEL